MKRTLGTADMGFVDLVESPDNPKQPNVKLLFDQTEEESDAEEDDSGSDDDELQDAQDEIKGENFARNHAKFSKGKKQSQKWTAGRHYISAITYKFERVIVDEAHSLRNPHTLISESVKCVQKVCIHCLTATPVLNHVRDLRGFLFQVYQQSWNVGIGFDAQNAYKPDFFPTLLAEHGKEGIIPPVVKQAWEKDKVFLPILDPHLYNTACNQEEFSAKLISEIMPPILQCLMVRIGYHTHVDMGDEKGTRVRVGESIPPCTWYATELEMDTEEQKQYDTLVLHLLSSMGTGFGEESEGIASTTAQRDGLGGDEGVGGLDGGLYRYVKHVTHALTLAALTKTPNARSKSEHDELLKKLSRNSWHNFDTDHGASFHYIMSRPASHFAVPDSRSVLAQYLAGLSPKTKFLLSRMLPQIKKDGKGWVIICEYPMTAWYVSPNLFLHP
jgi:SNF2 domain-containing protein